MAYQLHLTTNWSFDEMAPFGEDMTKAMAKLAARFPDDIDLMELSRQIADGQTQLWLILDEKKQFIAFLTSQMEITPTGKKRLLLMDLAGRGGVDLCDLLETIEDWARAQGAVAICPLGRPGWDRALKKQGYKKLIIRYGKEL